MDRVTEMCEHEFELNANAAVLVEADESGGRYYTKCVKCGNEDFEFRMNSNNQPILTVNGVDYPVLKARITSSLRAKPE